MIEQISGVLAGVLDWLMVRLWAAGPMPGWAYPMGWVFIGAGAASLAFLAGARWASDRGEDATVPPPPPAQPVDATAVLPRVDDAPAPRRHRRAARFALPRGAKTTRALSGTSTRSVSYAPGKAAPRR